MTILIAGAILSAVTDVPALVLVGQFIVGVGIGIDFPVSGAYVSETMPDSVRSRMVVATIALQSVGMLLGAAVALATLDASSAPSDWRWILGATGAGAALFLLLRLTLPESPRWLVEHGRAAEARRIVTKLLGKALPPPTHTATTATARPAAAIGKAASRRRPFLILFSRPLRMRTLLASVPWFLMDIATYGIGLFTPVILGAIHLASAESGTVAADFVDAQGSAAIDLFLLVGFVVGLWVVPRFGRIRMQVIGFAGMTLGMVVLIGVTLTNGGAAAHVPFVFAGFILFNLAMNAGPNATTFTLPPELFPTRVRATASGFAAAMAKVGATLGIFVLPQIKASWGVTGVLVLVAVVSALGLIVTALLASEARVPPDGLDLDDLTALK